ncbi:MAG: alpha/beta fold hydrolase [Cytophagales bacterium]|nr:alpha/beta fold hydrolase [Cytophagales bacterium]MDW8383215.1 alpha/beta fold hydrolase [Flammeovirgaceae bacterium]
MKRLAKFFSILFLLNACARSTNQVENTSDTSKIAAAFSGRWVGEISSTSYPDFMSVEYDSLPKFSIYYRGLLNSPILDFNQKNHVVTFKGNSEEAEELFFSGELKNNLFLYGIMKEKNKNHAFSLVKVTSNSVLEVNNFIGFYELDSGYFIKLTPFLLDASLTGVRLLDFTTCKQRVAFPIAPRNYRAGTRMLNVGGPREEIGFVVTSDSTLTFRISGLIKYGKRLPDLKEQPIRAKNKNITLAGSLTLPSKKNQKFPLVVYIPGSGEAFRGNVPDEYIQVLPYLGIATLVYDKRGCGESSGDFRSSTFYDLADDAIAIIKEASKNSKIDNTKIGLLTVGLGGYVLPLVVSKIPSIRFSVAISPPVIPMKEQELIACEKRMKADGFLYPDIQQALEYQESMFSYLEGKKDSLSFQQLSDIAISKPWKGYVTLFGNKEYIHFWRLNKDFNPESAWRKYQIPLLALFGKNDVLLNVSKNVQMLQEYLSENPKKEIKVLEKANHLLLLGAHRGDVQLTEIEGYAPETFKTIAEWAVIHTQ